MGHLSSKLSSETLDEVDGQGIVILRIAETLIQRETISDEPPIVMLWIYLFCYVIV